MVKRVIKDEEEKAEVSEGVLINEITTDFSRTDLNELKDKINELVRKAR